MADSRAPLTGEATGRKTFADWLEPWCAGFIACRDGLSDQDHEAFLKAAWDGYQQSGSTRAYRVNDGLPEREAIDLPPDLLAVLRDQSIIVPQDAAVFEAIARWRAAPSNTASADYCQGFYDWEKAIHAKLKRIEAGEEDDPFAELEQWQRVSDALATLAS